MCIKDKYHISIMAQYKHISIGQQGEHMATIYLERRGYHIVERNYRKKIGEIDIVAKKDNVLHFIEVKTGTYQNEIPAEGVEAYRAEDHIDARKYACLVRTVELYVREQGVRCPYTIDALVVYLNECTRRARIVFVPDISV